MCYQAELGRSALKDVGIIQENPKIGERWNSAHLAWLTPRYTPLPYMYYHVKFGSFLAKGVRINRRKPPNCGLLGPRPSPYVLSRQIWKGTPKIENTCAQPPCGGGRWPPRNTPVPTCFLPNFVKRYVKRYTSVNKEIDLKKNDSSRPAFQDHSRSSETTPIDTPSMTSY